MGTNQNDYVTESTEDHPTGDSSSKVAPVMPTHEEVLRTFIEEYKAAQVTSSHFQTRTFWLGVVTALIVLAYTTVAAFQLGQMKKATAATQRAANAAQASASAAQQSADTGTRALHSSYRPWIGIDGKLNVIGSIHQDPSKVNFLFDLKNTGTSVGLGIQTGVWVSDDFKILDGDHCRRMADTEKQAIYLAHKTHGKAGGVTPETGEVLFPNAHFTDREPPQEGAPVGTTENVYVLVCVAYFDQFEVAHFTKLDYCFTPWPLPEWKDLPQFCKQGNYAN